MTGERTHTAAAQHDLLFYRLVESVRDYAIFLLDPGGFVVTWNRGAERIKGYRADEIIGRHFSIFYPGVEARAGKPDYELKVAAADGRFEDEGWRLRRDGTRFWANVIISAVHDDNGVLVGFSKVTRDLTERKQAEDEREILLAAERQARLEAETARERLDAVQRVTEAGLARLDFPSLLDAILERVADVLSVDTAMVLLREGDEWAVGASVGFEFPIGRGTRAPLGAGWARRVADSGQLVVIDDSVEDEGLRRLLEGTGVSSLVGAPLIDGGSTLGVLQVGSRRLRRFTREDLALLRVVADRFALAIGRAQVVEEERAAQAEAFTARETARLRDEFVAIAAHELRTPLTGLRMSTELASRRLRARPGDVDRVQPLLTTALRQADRLDRLIGQLLDISRMDAGRFSLTIEWVDVAALVRDAAAITREISGVAITLDAPETLMVDADPLRVEQVVVNLLDNAARHGGSERPIEVRLGRDAGAWALTVRDHGAGVPPELRDSLFERFRSGQGPGRQTGLGLGLFISREIAAAHGGTLVAEFPADGGSRFVVRMPHPQSAASPD